MTAKLQDSKTQFCDPQWCMPVPSLHKSLLQWASVQVISWNWEILEACPLERQTVQDCAHYKSCIALHLPSFKWANRNLPGKELIAIPLVLKNILYLSIQGTCQSILHGRLCQNEWMCFYWADVYFWGESYITAHRGYFSLSQLREKDEFGSLKTKIEGEI